MNFARSQGKRIQLFNEFRTRVVKQLCQVELNDMAARGLIAWFKLNGRNAVYLVTAPKQSARYSSAGLPSPATLGRSDVELNALGAATGARIRVPGLNAYNERDPLIIGNAIDRSMSKVEAWPDVHDTKAVCISAGRVCQPCPA